MYSAAGAENMFTVGSYIHVGACDYGELVYTLASANVKTPPMKMPPEPPSTLR